MCMFSVLFTVLREMCVTTVFSTELTGFVLSFLKLPCGFGSVHVLRKNVTSSFLSFLFVWANSSVYNDEI